MRCFVPSLVAALVWCSLIVAEPAPLPANEQVNANVTPENVRFFEDYLSTCPENEIRCVWFLNDQIKVGMLMTINIQKHSVDTVREVYSWASQAHETRGLSHTQVASVKEIITALPPPVDNILFGKGVHLAYWKNGKVQTATYDRMAAPRILQRLYDIGGGYLDCKYGK